MMNVVIYTTRTCPYGRRAEALLRHHGVPFESIDVTNDPQTRAALVQRAHGRRTVPVIFHGDEVIGGYVELAALASTTELAHLKVAPPIAHHAVLRDPSRDRLGWLAACSTWMRR